MLSSVDSAIWLLQFVDSIYFNKREFANYEQKQKHKHKRKKSIQI